MNIISYANPFSQGHIIARITFRQLSKEQQACCVVAAAIFTLVSAYFSLLAAPFVGSIVFKLAVEFSDQMNRVNQIGLNNLNKEEGKKEKSKPLSELIKELGSTELITIETLSQSLPLINEHLCKHPEDAGKWQTFWDSLTKSNDPQVCIIPLKDELSIKISPKVLTLQSKICLEMIEDLKSKEDISIPMDLEIDQATIKQFFICLERGFIGQELEYKNAMDFLDLADYLEIEWAIKVCKEFVLSKLNQNNVVEVYKKYRNKCSLEDPLTKACLEKFVERFKNPVHLSELLDQFDEASRPALEYFLKDKPNYPDIVEILSLFFPKIINGQEASTLSVSLFHDIARYFQKISKGLPGFIICSGIHQEFLKAFKKICPSANFMTIEERHTLFKAFIDQSDGNFVPTLMQLKVTEFFQKNDEEVVYSYRKLFSEVMKYEDSLLPGSVLLAPIYKKPRNEQKQLIRLANIYFAEVRALAENGAIPGPAFKSYRENLIRLLLIVPEKDRERAATAFYKLYPLTYATSIHKHLREVVENNRLDLLENILSLTGNVERIKEDEFFITKFIEAYVSFHKNQLEWMIKPCLNFIKPKNLWDLLSISHIQFELLPSFKEGKLIQLLQRMEKHLIFLNSDHSDVSQVKMKLVNSFALVDDPAAENWVMEIAQTMKYITNEHLLHEMVEVMIETYKIAIQDLSSVMRTENLIKAIAALEPDKLSLEPLLLLLIKYPEDGKSEITSILQKIKSIIRNNLSFYTVISSTKHYIDQHGISNQELIVKNIVETYGVS